MNRIFVPSVAGAVLLETTSVHKRPARLAGTGKPGKGLGRLLAMTGLLAGVLAITSASHCAAQETGRGNQTARPNAQEQVYLPGDR
jgi:hypothetical protein